MSDRTFAFLVVGVGFALVAMRVMSGFEGDWGPNHFDEWRSLALAQRFVESGALVAEDPVGSANGLARDINDRNRSLGFVAVYAGWLRFAPDPIGTLKLLAGGFLFLYVAGAAWLLRTIGVRPLALFPALLAIGVMPTDARILGPALAVPSSLGLGLCALGWVAHLRLTDAAVPPSLVGVPPSFVRVTPSGAVATGRPTAWWILFGSVSLLLAVVYPLTLIVMGGLIAVDVLARPSLFRTTYVRLGLITGCVGAALFVTHEWQGGARATLAHFANLFLLDQQWHLRRYDEYRLDFLLHPVVMLIAMFGAGIAIAAVGDSVADGDDSEKRFGRNGAWIAAAFVAPFLACVVYQSFGVGLIVPYQRVGLYLNLGAVLCTGVAAEYALRMLSARGVARSAGVLAILVACLGIWFVPRADPPYEGPGSEIRPQPALAEAAKRIARDYPTTTTFFAPPLEALFVEGYTGLRADPSALDALLNGMPPPRFRCDGEWDLVIGGEHRCARFALAFRVDAVHVYEQRPTPSPNAMSGPKSLPRSTPK